LVFKIFTLSDKWPEKKRPVRRFLQASSTLKSESKICNATLHYVALYLFSGLLYAGTNTMSTQKAVPDPFFYWADVTNFPPKTARFWDVLPIRRNSELFPGFLRMWFYVVSRSRFSGGARRKTPFFVGIVKFLSAPANDPMNM
jgi:hypothetical protein